MIIAIIVVVVVLLLVFISISNGIVRSQVKIQEARSGIDVALTKRYDVLTKAIEVVKGYAKHEEEVLFKVIELRSGMTTAEQTAANNEMNDQFSKINVLAEQYPELRSSDNYKTLQLSINDVEEHLQAARRLYNSNVSSYNQMIRVFPNSIIANMKGCKEEAFFEADDAKKEDVKINL